MAKQARIIRGPQGSSLYALLLFACRRERYCFDHSLSSPFPYLAVPPSTMASPQMVSAAQAALANESTTPMLGLEALLKEAKVDARVQHMAGVLSFAQRPAIKDILLSS